MSYFVYLNDGGWIVSQFKSEADADDRELPIGNHYVGVLYKADKFLVAVRG